jgi:hypothetical protein
MHLPGIAAGLLLLGSVSIATPQTVVIAPEQETVVREYVTKQNVASVELPADVTLETGRQKSPKIPKEGRREVGSEPTSASL